MSFLDVWLVKPRDPKMRTMEVTEDAALQILKQWRSNPNAELMGRKPDGTLYLKEVVNKNDYRVYRRDDEREDVSDRVWICNYGDRHALDKSCECAVIMGVTWLKYLGWCQESFGINHIHQIEVHMRCKFLT